MCDVARSGVVPSLCGWFAHSISPSFDKPLSDAIGPRPISATLIEMAHHDVDKTTCRMCSKAAPLENSHVIPAFVYRWLKETSATGYLRTAIKPNVRVQDGPRRYWFCRRCEDTMGRHERAFSDSLFLSIVSGAPAPYPHGPWLSRFLASVVLRVAMLHAEHPGVFDLATSAQRAVVPQALEQWRAFVLGEVETLGIHELHFLPLGLLAHAGSALNLPSNFNRYMMLSTDMHVASNSAQAFVYVKMGPAIAFGLIHPPVAELWRGTRVAVGDGYVGGSMGLSVPVLKYLIDRAEQMELSVKHWSSRQEHKIVQAMMANPERTAASTTFRAIAADVERFGRARVFPPDDEASGGSHAT